MKVKEYTCKTAKDIASKKIAVVSNLHLSEKTKSTKFYNVLSTLDDIKPSHIVIPGNLYNVDDSTINEFYPDIVTRFIEYATAIAPIYYVKGNSELDSDVLPSGFYNNNSNLNILGENGWGFIPNHNYIETDDLRIAALKMAHEFYELDERAKVIELLEEFRICLEKLVNSRTENAYNILLCPDPIVIELAEKIKLLENFDLIIAGNNRNILPESLKPLLKLMGANIDKLYPSYKKGIEEKGNATFLVSEGITKYHSKMKALEKLERFHEGTIEVVNVLSRKQQ